LCGYLLIKKSFARSNELLKSKNMDCSFDGTSQNAKKIIDSHSKFVIGIQYMMYYEIINPNIYIYF